MSDIKEAVVSSFADPTLQREMMRKRNTPRIRRRNRGVVWDIPLYAAVDRLLLANETTGVPSHEDPSVRQCRLDDMKLAAWLQEEYPQSTRKLNSWVRSLKDMRSAYNRGKSKLQLKTGSGVPEVQSHQYIGGEAQPIIRRPRKG